MKNKTQLIHDVGERVLSANYLQNLPWQSLSLVIDLGEGLYAESGFLYLDNETKHLSITSDVESQTIMNELCDIIKAEVNLTAVQSLIQVNSDDKKIKLNFEFYNKDLWSITSDNIAQKMDELRLKPDEDNN